MDRITLNLVPIPKVFANGGGFGIGIGAQPVLSVDARVTLALALHPTPVFDDVAKLAAEKLLSDGPRPNDKPPPLQPKPN
jgi:hypothetical protein